MTVAFSLELLIFTLLALLLSICLRFRSNSRTKNPSMLPTNWPIIHMLPSFIANLHKVHDYFAAGLAEISHNSRVYLPQGRIFVTCDPMNIRHIFTANHANFPKGAEFAAIFDIMDGGFFTVDGELWRRQRLKFRRVLSSPQLVASMAACCHNKVEKGLIPLFTHMASTTTPFDMQEVVARFMFDLAATPLFGVDPGLLSPDMPPKDVAVAMDTIMEVGFLRHVMPAYFWKVMRRLNIGPERKLDAAHKMLRAFVADMIEKKISGGLVCNDEEQAGVDILSSYINDADFANDNLLCAMLISFMLAGRDTIGTTLTWIFYILAHNPTIVSSIRNELAPIASKKVAMGTGAMLIFEPEETKSLVYLKAVLYETLRLYPPGPFERKTVVADDIMPSGHKVKAGEMILISIYSMGRMEGIWGKDCHDYKPHRWLSDDGNKLRYIPSHKFLSFNSGPRMCPGKDIAIMQMKIVVATLVWNFEMEVLEGQSIQPKLSCTLQMKNGLKMKLKKRDM